MECGREAQEKEEEVFQGREDEGRGKGVSVIGGLERAMSDDLTPQQEVEDMNNAWHETMSRHTDASGTRWDDVMREWKVFEDENYMWASFRPLRPHDWQEAMSENDENVGRHQGNLTASRKPSGILDRTMDPRDKFRETAAKAKAVDKVFKK